MYTRRLPALVLAALLAIGLLAGCAGSRATSAPSGSSAQAQNGSAQDSEDDGFKPYDEVITDEAETDDGLLTTHRIEKKLYFEIPDSLFGREILSVSRVSQAQAELAYGGQKVNTQVFRWQRNGDEMLLRVVSHEKTADPEDPVYRAVQNSKFEPIIRTFSIEALSRDSAGVVIDVTELFTEDVPALGLPSETREQYKVRRLDGSRTFIADVESFPLNTDIEAVLTYEAQEPPSSESTGSISVEMNHSMVLLPKAPIQPRLCDDRVGYISVEMVNYSAPEQKAKEDCYIVRWPLEPKDPEALARGELVEPKEPIVYYIDPAAPEKWRPYIKQGVEDWQEAFEAAGFKNAILAKDPPSEEEDPDFDPDDVRYSVIRYFASEVQNAYGPNVHDPRSGEILESDIGWFHNVMNLLRNWYFIQTAPANPEARGRVFDEEVMGQLIRFVAAHEVGHTLGLPHNWGASHAVPVDSLRSPSYTSTHGTAPSIMDYARFNYVAQPEDGVTQFMPRIGPYDIWAVQFGYQPLPEAGGDPEAEAQMLDDMILERADDPRYFYGRQTASRVDPRSQNEDLGCDAVRASELGVENLERVVPNLVAWTRKDGADYQELEELYGVVVNQWERYMGHVGRHVGGVFETFKTYEQEGPVYEPVPADQQRAAMQFLNEQAFQTPSWLVEADVLRRFESAGALERIREAQVGALELLLEPQRMARLMEAEAVESGTDPYPAGEMLAALRRGIWSELERGAPIDPFRRNLQRGYLERLDYLMTAEVEPPPEQFREFFVFTPVNVRQSDIRAHVRSELQALRGEVERGLRRTQDATTRMHLEDVLARIDNVLDEDEE